MVLRKWLIFINDFNLVRLQLNVRYINIYIYLYYVLLYIIYINVSYIKFERFELNIEDSFTTGAKRLMH